MTKKTLTVTLPDGRKVSTTTDRPYTHAVITGTAEAAVRAQVAEANGPAATAWWQEKAERAAAAGGVLWELYSHASRADLAWKVARQLRNVAPDLDVRVVPVD